MDPATDSICYLVHDDIGRGNFLALYLGSGVFASFTSLLFHIMRGNLMVTGLGASGAISGLVATLCLLHAEYVSTSIPQASWHCPY